MSGKIDVMAGLKGMLEYIEMENIDHLQQDILKGAIGLIEEERKELEPTSHSEKHIVENCIALMESVHQNMLEYMEHMGFEYDSENKEEVPQFNYSYFEIVQQLLLWRTSHGGGTSTREKCDKLGFDSYETVIIGGNDY